MTGAIGLFFILEKGLSLQEFALLQLFFNVGAFLFEYPSSYFSDKLGPKIVVLLGSLFTSLYFLFMALFSSFLLLAIAETLHAVGGSLITGSRESWLRDITQRCDQKYSKSAHKITKISNLLSVITGNIGIFIAYVTKSFEIVFFISFVLFIIPLILYIKTPNAEKQESRPLSPIKSFQENRAKIFSLFKNKSWLLYSAVVIAFMGSFQVFYHFWQPIFISDKIETIQDYSSANGILLALLYSLIFISKGLFSHVVHKKDFHSVGTKSSFWGALSLLMSMGFLLFSEKSGNNSFLYLAMFFFVIMHGFISLVLPQIEAYLSVFEKDGVFAQAFSITEIFGRGFAILVMYLAYILLDYFPVKWLLFIPILLFLMMGKFFMWTKDSNSLH